nr:LacI family DNA-binding transcriptional regulator [uncultured Treponema sp.]
MERFASAVTIADIAEKLGVSKSTVSRAINCKGRIGAETRRRIIEMAESCNYIPNPMAKGLVLRRTFNIGVVIPRDADKGDIPFFQNCLVGISESVYKLDYDVVLVVQAGNDIIPLRRLVTNRKVDGVILTRLEENDESVKFLKKEGIPFLVFGTSNDEELYQIDSDQVSGCFEMTRFMISKGCSRVAVLGGNINYRVNGFRLKGFEDACISSGISLDGCPVYWGMDDQRILDETLPEIMKDNPQCLVCMDDAICVYVLKWLKQNEYEIPADIQVISFYDNQVLENNTPPVTSLSVNVSSFAGEAGKILTGLIEGKEVPKKTSVGYELKIRESFR